MHRGWLACQQFFHQDLKSSFKSLLLFGVGEPKVTVI